MMVSPEGPAGTMFPHTVVLDRIRSFSNPGCEDLVGWLERCVGTGGDAWMVRFLGDLTEFSFRDQEHQVLFLLAWG
jgi:hypothetical protein